MKDQYVRKALSYRVVDGDTIDFELDLGWNITLLERCRLLDVDTPEMRGPEKIKGEEYKLFVVRWLAGCVNIIVECLEYRHGKYGRSLVNVYGDGLNLNTVLRQKMHKEENDG